MLRFFELVKNEDGAVAVEYGLILALIFLAMIAGVQNFASETTSMWNNVTEAVQGA